MIRMRIDRRLLAAAGAVVVVAAGGIGVAYAVSGDSEEQATGPEAEQAKSAALEQVGGGTVVGVERQDGDGPGAYEVEVKRDHGSQVEVYVSDANRVVGTEADDDSGSGEENESGEREDD
jgi:Peptidase propeptide and YPEB domain